MEQVRDAPALDTAVPAVVLVAEQTDESPAYHQLWIEMQRERAAELGAEYVLAEGATHFLQNDRPDLVLQAIEDVIEQHRRNPAQ
jgi:pimeloyl-ACP methyl ester carboxylesterase